MGYLRDVTAQNHGGEAHTRRNCGNWTPGRGSNRGNYVVCGEYSGCMGEPIAGRVSEEAKGELEYVADKRNTSVSNLVGSIVEVWLRDRRAGDAEEPERETDGQNYAEDFDELAGQVETLRHHLEIVVKNSNTTTLKPWVMRQAYDERRAWDDMEPPDQPRVRTTFNGRDPKGP